MKRIFLLPFLFLFSSPVIAEVEKDPRILCIRNQTAYDVSFEANWERDKYKSDIWLPAFNEEEKKFAERGEKIYNWSVHEEPYKSIQENFYRLRDISSKKRDAYAKTLVPILELAGYERPDFYLWYYTSYLKEILKRHNTNDLKKVEEYFIGQDYFSHTGSGNDVRDKLCKLYGVEFDYKYDEWRKRRFGS